MQNLFAKKTLIGLDIGTSTVKIVELDEISGKYKEKYKLKNLGVAKIPRETISNGVIINADPLVQAIKSLLSSLKITNKNAAVSVSGNNVIIKKITLPVMNESELEKIIYSEAEQYIPFDLDEVNIDFQILGANEENAELMDLMLVAAKKVNIQDYLDALNAAGIIAKIIDIDVFALENMFSINYAQEENEVCALIDIGANITNINIMKNGSSIFNRDALLGGNLITEEIQKELLVSFEEAEMLKTGEVIEGIDKELLEQTISKTVSSITREIQRTIDFFTGQTYAEITHIYLSGGSSRMHGLKEMLEEKYSGIVQFVDPFKSIKYDTKNFDAEYMNEIAPVAAIGVGLAIRKIGVELK
jgi:type IV pilus assembly protein PilM